MEEKEKNSLKEKEEIKDSKESKGEEKKEKKETHITLHEFKFLFFLLIKTLILPFLILVYVFKKEPLKPIKEYFSFIDKEMLVYHKQALILVALNVLVYIIEIILKNTNENWLIFFVSSKENYYLFNLNFLAHANLTHLLSNLFFLYFTAYILSYKFNVIKLYFIFGFLINFLMFLTSFFYNIPENLGASGVISAFMILSLVFYPFGLSILLVILYFLINIPFSSVFLYLDFLSNVFLAIDKYFVYKNIFILSHLYGFLVGCLYSFLKWNELNGLKKFILIFLFLFTIFAILKVLF